MNSALESVLFAVGEEGLDITQITEIMEIDEEKVKELIGTLIKKYESDDSGIELKLLGNKYKLTTKSENSEYLKKLTDTVSNTLSKSALETLAIIAYNEPITRVQIDEIRGVNSSQMVRNLLSKGFIEDDGKSDMPGKPILYKTTNHFLDYFGLSTKEELPKINMEDIEVLDDEDLFLSRYKEEVGEN